MQVVDAAYYDSLSSGQHGFYEELFASRGDILVKDWIDGEEYLAATNEKRAFLYADPRRVEDPVTTAQALAGILRIPVTEIVPEVEGEVQSEYEVLLARLSKNDDPYEPLARDLSQEVALEIEALQLPGIAYTLQESRCYPEENIGGQIFGFLGVNEGGEQVGQYGLEGFFEDFLSGFDGSITLETDAAGQWIGVGKRNFVSAVNGGDLLLTIDRTIQYEACKALKEGVEAYGADSGSLVILDPSTGKVMAMCNAPDFDPNHYGDVDSISIFNNTSIMQPYESGSVMKPLVMAAAIDSGALQPTSTFNDTGVVVIDDYEIHNSDLKAHGIQTMTQVLEKSLNTGMVYVMQTMGGDVMKEYLKNFGLGSVSGIELSTEVSGTLESLDEPAEIYDATASFGQGITVTVLQLASAYAALANGGILYQPYIVEEQRYDDGTVVPTVSNVVRQVISKKTATTIAAMLVSVIENGHGGKAAVPGYYIAGKTGTAQVAKQGSIGYEEDYTMATFAGFGPVDDPKFVMVVMLDHPRSTEWAESSSTIIFHNVAEFLLSYLQVAPTRAQ